MNEEEQLINGQRKKGRYIALALFLLLVVIALLVYFSYKNFCQSSVKYRIGSIDPRFNLDSQYLKNILIDSESRWDDTAAQNLFEYDENAALEINLVYDQRQADLDYLKSTVNSLNNANQSLEDWNERLKQMIAGYDADLSDYNATVSYWNNQGGAPADVFADLERRRIALEQRRNEINKAAEALNIQVQKYNLSVDQIKTEADKNKNKLITQGMFYSKENKIDIYTFGNEQELRLVLMHELGHAKGAGHASSDLSIMYPVLGSQELEDPLPSAEDVQMLKNCCVPRLMNLLSTISPWEGYGTE